MAAEPVAAAAAARHAPVCLQGLRRIPPLVRQALQQRMHCNRRRLVQCEGQMQRAVLRIAGGEEQARIDPAWILAPPAERSTMRAA
jgi:hypothetical protein